MKLIMKMFFKVLITVFARVSCNIVRFDPILDVSFKESMSVVDLSVRLEKDRSLHCMSLCKSDPLCGGIFIKRTDPLCYLASISTVELDDLQEDPGYTSYRLIPLASFADHNQNLRLLSTDLATHGVSQPSSTAGTNSSDWSCSTDYADLPLTGYYWGGINFNGTAPGSSLSDCCDQCGGEASYVDFYSEDGTCYCSTPGEDETPCLFQSSNYEAGICSGWNFTETNSSDWSCLTSLPPLPVTGYYWAGMDFDGTEDGTSLEDCCSLCQTASHVDFQSGEEGSSGTCYCSTPGEEDTPCLIQSTGFSAGTCGGT